MHDDDDVACMHDIGPGNGCNHRRERVIAYIITIHTLVTHTHSSIKGRKQRERERGNCLSPRGRRMDWMARSTLKFILYIKIKINGILKI